MEVMQTLKRLPGGFKISSPCNGNPTLLIQPSIAVTFTIRAWPVARSIFDVTEANERTTSWIRLPVHPAGSIEEGERPKCTYLELFRGPFKVYFFLKEFILWAFKECFQAFLRVLEIGVSHTAHLKSYLHLF